MKISFGCELAYRVNKPTVFVLHVEAARIASHAGLADGTCVSFPIWRAMPRSRR